MFRLVYIIAPIAFVLTDRIFAAPPSMAEGLTLLEDVEDNTFSFDDEAFYWFCRHLREEPDALGTAECETDDVVPWRFLLERPSDYRGQPVCIEGRLLREQPSYEVAGRPGVGRLRQLELGTTGSNAVATMILLDDRAVLKKRSLIRANAIFIKTRAFQTEGGAVGSGPLLIASRIELIESGPEAPQSTATIDARRMLPWIAGATLLLFGVMVAMRRNIGATSPPGDDSVPDSPATGTDEDFDWLSKDSEKPG